MATSQDVCSTAAHGQPQELCRELAELQPGRDRRCSTHPQICPTPHDAQSLMLPGSAHFGHHLQPWQSHGAWAVCPVGVWLPTVPLPLPLPSLNVTLGAVSGGALAAGSAVLAAPPPAADLRQRR